MTQWLNSRRLRLLVAVATMAALLVVGSVAVGTASEHLADAESIELILGTDDDGSTPFNGFRYGTNEQLIETNKAACSVKSESLSGPIMIVTAESYDKKDVKVPEAEVGLVEDGLGVNISGKGNAQDCGRIDELANDRTETLTLELGEGVAGRLIRSVEFDFEAKYDAVVLIEFLLDGSTLDHIQEVTISDGSDSGPDAGSGDKYRVIAPELDLPEGEQFLFDGVRISMDSGGVSLEGGATWEDPIANRTVFHLQPALACGESTSNGGQGLNDSPRAAFYVGPNKDGSDCAVPVTISTANPAGGEQTVIVAPPGDFDWVGVTGVVTIEWDQEDPDDDPIERTLQRLVFTDPDSDVTIPWCEEIVGIARSSSFDWMYELSPDVLYEFATGEDAAGEDNDVCLIKQTTQTVLGADGVKTQTTEVFYIWNDPMWVRK